MREQGFKDVYQIDDTLERDTHPKGEVTLRPFSLFLIGNLI